MNAQSLAAPVPAALLAWFAANARDLPWRRTRDPYRILVAEIMLQQTQVDRVIPKYLAFLDLFPTIQVLAEAPTAEVIRAWAGLGYNRRAVNLQRTAQTVLRDYGSTFPHDVAGLRALPGIGPYTAGAVACFAFEQPVAFLDTNIRRVLLRLTTAPSAPPPADATLLDAWHAALPHDQAWAANQAIMELGALVCTARSPACPRCPLRAWCADYQGRVAEDQLVFATPAPVRRIAERREAPYAGSNRWYRGRVVAALRDVPAGHTLTLAALGPLVRDDYVDELHDWLSALVDGLARDGLLMREGDTVRLP
jgi:A/G-specific adenine glycosylase